MKKQARVYHKLIFFSLFFLSWSSNQVASVPDFHIPLIFYCDHWQYSLNTLKKEIEVKKKNDLPKTTQVFRKWYIYSKFATIDSPWTSEPVAHYFILCFLYFYC